MKGIEKMTETDKIARARQYMELLAKGINPLTGVNLIPGECASEERMKRCFEYTAGILARAYDRELREEYRTVRKNAADFNLSPEELARFEFSDEPIGAGKLKEKLNALVDKTVTKPLKVTSITAFLISAGLLANEDGEKRPTPEGAGMGITVERRTNPYGAEFEQILYSKQAQQFIIDNIDALCALNADNATRKALTRKTDV